MKGPVHSCTSRQQAAGAQDDEGRESHNKLDSKDRDVCGREAQTTAFVRGYASEMAVEGIACALEMA